MRSFTCTKVGDQFLFAVVRDVQRNWLDWFTPEEPSSLVFLFAVVRDVQRNPAMKYGPSMWQEFLFAVVRDVQRNAATGSPTHRQRRSCFYSLSCETYSGTLGIDKTSGITTDEMFSIRCRARRTAELLHAASQGLHG